ncbi:glycerophosphoryl diester phosphodiesterase [Methanocorpusculum labreanum Z]|uniref:Glycerophosphoryl diester phosphodiesterase n=1 Tax=Methanocorpusculum labreanum (strain ATCC 43576 / DSM 4855 / Z) TaxID=410358 RepID=A2SSB0_METLZ|nr:glycerophosphodiester phosphodiesterase family protein [Methanocorpusculum labreanum]ABN07216.1 glycerophosphoryl diester phosphodiesterase [Methanocorpusculum labreanum Z]
MIIVYVLIILIAAASLYLFLLYPGKTRKERMLVFTQYFIAHRGLFDNTTAAPENSLPAFQKAVDAGYGIELDVQLTKDNEVIVLHDDNLRRSSKVDTQISDCTYERLQEYRLFHSDEKIPKLSDVLSLVNGTVPLVIELKNASASEYAGLCERTAACLDTYNGVFGIESFNPMIVRWFWINRPEYLRGFLSTDYRKELASLACGEPPKLTFLEKFVLTNCLMNFFIRPDFIAYNIRYKDQPSYRICTKLFGIVKVGWTIRSKKELDTAVSSFDVIIFDSFLP